MAIPADRQFITGTLETAAGPVPSISPVLGAGDYWGSFKARIGAGRMNYKVDPGLYALGNPTPESDVLVTANYKLTFDTLRRQLNGMGLWILVLDTDGVNVWCAAGKKTFATMELVHGLEESGLKDILSHRRLILPQLGAAGISAHKVRELTDFKVLYGPVEAKDIPAFIAAGHRADKAMRNKTFHLMERIKLIPVDLNMALRISLLIIAIVAILGGVLGSGGFMEGAKRYGIIASIWLLAAILGGSVLTPIVLPWAPGRAFAVKGIIPGIFSALGAWYLVSAIYPDAAWSIQALSWFIISVTGSTFMAMNFTGSSTYTSLSGVRREMRFAIPIQAGAVIIAAFIWIVAIL